MTRVFFSVQVCWRGSGWLSLVSKAAGLRELVSGCCVGGWLVCSYRWGGLVWFGCAHGIGRIGAARSGFGCHGLFDLRVGSYGFTQLCVGVDRVASSCLIGRIGAARSGLGCHEVFDLRVGS